MSKETRHYIEYIIFTKMYILYVGTCIYLILYLFAIQIFKHFLQKHNTDLEDKQ